MDMFMLLWRRYRTDPLVHSCRNMILQHIHKHGITFTRDGKEVELSPTEKALVEDYWKPFSRQVFDSIVCHGFVPVEICEDNFGHRYPRVPAPGTYRLHMSARETEFQAFDLVTNEALDVFFLTGFDYDVLPGGVFTSQMAKILPRIGFLRELRKTAIDLEYSRVTPQHFSEIPVESHNEREGVDFDWFCEGSTGSMDSKARFTRNREQIDQLRQQEEFYETRSDVTRKTRVALKNIVQLPMGHRLRAVASQPGRHDLVPIVKILQEEICTCLGVPRALQISDSIYRSSTEGIDMAFKHTLLNWKTIIGEVMTKVWVRVYVEELKKSVKKPESAYKLTRLNRMEIMFPVAPYVSM